MKLSKDSFHKRFYESWWQKDAPTNLCNYVWGLLFALITVPFLFMGRIFDIVAEESEDASSVAGIAFMYFILTLGTIFVAVIVGMIIGVSLVYYKVALAIIAVLAISIYSMYSYSQGEAAYMATEYVKAKKNNICPRITWE